RHEGRPAARPGSGRCRPSLLTSSRTLEGEAKPPLQHHPRQDVRYSALLALQSALIVEKLANCFTALCIETKHRAHKHVSDPGEFLDLRRRERGRHPLEASQLHEIFLFGLVRTSVVRCLLKPPVCLSQRHDASAGLVKENNVS